MGEFFTMKLILENWRKYLIREQEELYFPGLKELKESEDDFINVLSDTSLFRYVDEGAFRKVYFPVGDDKHVVKMVSDPTFTFMNKMEVELSKKYPLLMPKTYAHGACYEAYSGETICDYDWIYMEAVNVIVSSSKRKKEGEIAPEIEEMLKTSFPEIVRLTTSDNLVKRYMYTRGNRWSPDGEVLWRLIQESIEFGAKDYKKYTSLDRSFTEDPSFTLPPVEDFTDILNTQSKPQMHGKKIKDKHKIAALKRIFDVGMLNKTYAELFKIVTTENAAINDIRPGNFGLDSDLNLKIIDASIFIDPAERWRQ